MPALVDIDAPYASPTLEVFAVDTVGELWIRSEDADGKLSAWQAWSDGNPPTRFVALAVSLAPEEQGTPLVLAGVSDDQGVYVRTRLYDVWQDWQRL